MWQCLRHFLSCFREVLRVAKLEFGLPAAWLYGSSVLGSAVESSQALEACAALVAAALPLAPSLASAVVLRAYHSSSLPLFGRWPVEPVVSPTPCSPRDPRAVLVLTLHSLVPARLQRYLEVAVRDRP